MSLCFLEAQKRFIQKILSEDKYITHLLAHFRRDIHHDEDQQRGKSRSSAERFRGMELYAQSIRHAAVVKRDYEPLESTVEIETIFHACLTGDVEAVRSAYGDFPNPGQVAFLPALATLAVERKKSGVLEFCLEQGVVADQYLNSAVRLNHDIGIFEVLYAANWKGIQDSRTTMNSIARELVHHKDTSEALEWFLDHGAIIRGAAVQKAASFYYRPPASLLRKLLEVDPKAARNHDTMAYAASRGFTDVVQQMLDGGLAADAPLPAWHPMDFARDGPNKTTLFHAVCGDDGDMKITDDHIETAKILLDNGARPDRSCGYNLETPLSVALNLRKSKQAMTKLLISYPATIQ